MQYSFETLDSIEEDIRLREEGHWDDSNAGSPESSYSPDKELEGNSKSCPRSLLTLASEALVSNYQPKILSDKALKLNEEFLDKIAQVKANADGFPEVAPVIPLKSGLDQNQNKFPSLDVQKEMIETSKKPVFFKLNPDLKCSEFFPKIAWNVGVSFGDARSDLICFWNDPIVTHKTTAEAMMKAVIVLMTSKNGGNFVLEYSSIITLKDFMAINFCENSLKSFVLAASSGVKCPHVYSNIVADFEFACFLAVAYFSYNLINCPNIIRTWYRRFDHNFTRKSKTEVLFFVPPFCKDNCEKDLSFISPWVDCCPYNEPISCNKKGLGLREKEKNFHILEKLVIPEISLDYQLEKSLVDLESSESPIENAPWVPPSPHEICIPGYKPSNFMDKNLKEDPPIILGQLSPDMTQSWLRRQVNLANFDVLTNLTFSTFIFSMSFLCIGYGLISSAFLAPMLIPFGWLWGNFGIWPFILSVNAWCGALQYNKIREYFMRGLHNYIPGVVGSFLVGKFKTYSEAFKRRFNLRPVWNGICYFCSLVDRVLHINILTSTLVQLEKHLGVEYTCLLFITFSGWIVIGLIFPAVIWSLKKLKRKDVEEKDFKPHGVLKDSFEWVAVTFSSVLHCLGWAEENMTDVVSGMRTLTTFMSFKSAISNAIKSGRVPSINDFLIKPIRADFRKIDITDFSSPVLSGLWKVYHSKDITLLTPAVDGSDDYFENGLKVRVPTNFKSIAEKLAFTQEEIDGFKIHKFLLRFNKPECVPKPEHDSVILLSLPFDEFQDSCQNGFHAPKDLTWNCFLNTLDVCSKVFVAMGVTFLAFVIIKKYWSYFKKTFFPELPCDKLDVQYSKAKNYYSAKQKIFAPETRRPRVYLSDDDFVDAYRTRDDIEYDRQRDEVLERYKEDQRQFEDLNWADEQPDDDESWNAWNEHNEQEQEYARLKYEEDRERARMERQREIQENTRKDGGPSPTSEKTTKQKTGSGFAPETRPLKSFRPDRKERKIMKIPWDKYKPDAEITFTDKNNLIDYGKIVGSGRKGFLKIFRIRDKSKREFEIPMKCVNDVFKNFSPESVFTPEAMLPASPIIPRLMSNVYNVYADDDLISHVGQGFSWNGCFITAGHVLSVLVHNEYYKEVDIGTVVVFRVSNICSPTTVLRMAHKVLYHSIDNTGEKDVCLLQPVKKPGCVTNPLVSSNIMSSFDPQATYMNCLWWMKDGEVVLTVGNSVGCFHGASGKKGTSGAPLYNCVTRQVVGIHTGALAAQNQNKMTPLGPFIDQFKIAIANSSVKPELKDAFDPHGLIKWWDVMSPHPIVKNVPYIFEPKYVSIVGYMPNGTKLDGDLYKEFQEPNFTEWAGYQPEVEKFRISSPTYESVNKSFLKYDLPDDCPCDVKLVNASVVDLLEFFDDLKDKAPILDFGEVSYRPGAVPGWVMNKIFKRATKEQAWAEQQYIERFWNSAHVENYQCLFQQAGKVENLPSVKINTEDHRGFIIEPFELFVFDARMNQGLNHLMCQPEFYNTNPIKHGFCMYGGGFAALVKELNSIIDAIFFSGDCKRWDSRFKKLLADICLIVRFHCWDKKGMSVDEWWSRQHYVYNQNLYSFVLLPTSQVLQKKTGQNSGKVNTTDDNCIGHLFVWCYMWRKFFKFSLFDACRLNYIKLALYADDHVVSVNRTFDISNFAKRSQVYSELGLMLDPVKDLVTDTYVGQTFLGFQAHYKNKNIVPMFDESKVFNALAKMDKKQLDPVVVYGRAVSYAYLVAFNPIALEKILDFLKFLRLKFPQHKFPAFLKRDAINLWFDF